MKMKERNVKIEKPMSDIKMNIINSLLAGSLVFLGSFSTGDITVEGVCLSLVAALAVAISKFQNFWKKYMGKKGNGSLGMSLFNFVG